MILGNLLISNNFRNCELIFRLAEEELGIPSLLDPADMVDFFLGEGGESAKNLNSFLPKLVKSNKSNPPSVQASCDSPDRLSILTYLSEFYHKFKAEKSPAHSPSPGEPLDDAHTLVEIILSL